MRQSPSSCPAVRPAFAVLTALIVLVATVPLRADDGLIPFDSDRWVRYNAEVTEYLGRECLIGTAFLPNIAFENGIIEYDIAVDGSRGYPGVMFRAAGQLANGLDQAEEPAGCACLTDR